MSTTYADDFDTGEIEIPRQVGEQTLNLAPFIVGPPDLRRPDATGEIPVVRPDETGLNILRPTIPAAPFYRRYRGRHRREPSVLPVLLVLVGLWVFGCGAAMRMVGAF
jgi:hypothetical protein